MTASFSLPCLLWAALAGAGPQPLRQSAAPRAPAARVPVLYSTDLFHPHDDPDDHFDLAVLYALPGLDLKGLVLDQGAKQKERPGRTAVAQLARITGREVPVAVGLSRPLRSPDDKALDEPAEFQGGVRFLLEALRASPVPVRVATTGSVRDFVAAYNREPELLKSKIDRVVAFIGEASVPEHQEYNVRLDPHAYVGLLRSGLPLWWVPCFDGGPFRNEGRASLWRARQRDLLRDVSPRVLQYFIYALEKETADPLEFLDRPVDPACEARLLAGERNLWCAAVLGVLAGRRVLRHGRGYALTAEPRPGMPGIAGGEELFTFRPIEITVTGEGQVRYGEAPGSRRVWRFEVCDRARYAEGMTAVTAVLLARLSRSGGEAARKEPGE